MNPLRYRGYVYDNETQFYYLQSRYYDPEIGRFLNADALVSTGQGILGNNMFAYCLNNPVNMGDAAGNIPKELSLQFFAASAYGGGASNFGPYIPISIPYDDIPYDEESLARWLVRHNCTNEAKLLGAVSDILDGKDLIKAGAIDLFAPIPTVVEDLWGMTKIINGIFQTVVGTTKLVIWIINQA